MNSRIYRILQWNQITEKLAAFAGSPLGREEALKLEPFARLSDVTSALAKTRDAESRFLSFGSVSFAGANDIRESLLRLKVDATLSMSEIYHIGELLKTAGFVKSYGEKKESEDSLTACFNELEPLTVLQKEIEIAFPEEDEISDEASPALKDIRRKIRNAEAKIRTELNSLVLSHNSALQSTVITMRNGRYCVPVKNECRNEVPGMIHDESGSGATVFIEPLAIVQLNNDIRLYQGEEKDEIERILADFSARLCVHRKTLEKNLQNLAHLDFVFAKAQYARSIKAECPSPNSDGIIDLKEARHPLLTKKEIVPIDIRLGENFDTLIITGPNTGGKTVSMKTLGLLSLMAQAGLFIPAREGSRTALFDEIFADIGDEQSIEQNLSTFSAHLKSIVEILKRATSKSLVLLDELCAGTDPEEGAALAISIINELRRKNCRIAATTHYSEIKLFALSTPNVENASCEFNVQTLSPTYKLLIGIPGKSNAFAISKRLGLPESIIEEAKDGIDSNKIAFEDVIRDLHDSKKQMEKEQNKIGKLRYEAKRLQESLENEEQKLKEKEDRILAKAKTEASEILRDAKAKADEIIRELNKKGNDVSDLEKARTKAREELKKLTDTPEKKIQKSDTKASDLALGAPVYVLSLNMRGVVTKLPDKQGRLTVQIGIMENHTVLSDVVLDYEESEKSKSRNRSSVSYSSGAQTISTELNIIGLTTDESRYEVESYLDRAFLAHLSQVRIVHGRGTGALRKMVHDICKSSKHVKQFRLGEYGEGDTGVTIVYF